MFVKGGNVQKTSGGQSIAKEFSVTGSLVAATDTTVGGVIKVQNTFGVDLIVTDVILDVATASSGAAALDVGVDDGGDVSSDTLLDGVSVATAGIKRIGKNNGTNGGGAVWKADEYVVATASATTAGMVGTYKIVAIAR